MYQVIGTHSDNADAANNNVINNTISTSMTCTTNTDSHHVKQLGCVLWKVKVEIADYCLKPLTLFQTTESLPTF